MIIMTTTTTTNERESDVAGVREHNFQNDVAYVCNFIRIYIAFAQLDTTTTTTKFAARLTSAHR